MFVLSKGFAATALFGLALAGASPAAACGADTDCTLAGDHSYRIHLPPGHDPSAQIPALVFAHGYKGSARGTMRNKKLKALAEELGFVLIALDARMDDWSLANAPASSIDPDLDEMAYLDAVMADAASRFGVTAEKSVVAGFSAGGMMTWTVACARGDAFAGYIPIAGVFWAPIPQSCAAPAAPLIHIHGSSDRMVPLEGRAIDQTRQGDVRETLAMYARHGTFTDPVPAQHESLACEERRNAEGLRLDLCLHDGGHRFSIADLRAAILRLTE